MTIQDVLKTIVTYTIAFVMVSMLIITMPLVLDTHQSMTVSTQNGAISYLEGNGFVVLAQAGSPLANDLYTRNVYPGTGSTFDVGANGTEYAEGWFDKLYAGGSEVVRTATFVVAASDASAASIAQSDFQCDGVDDQVEIQAAIDALPVMDGIVQLTEGNFYPAAAISAEGGTWLRGMGLRTVIWPQAGVATTAIEIDGTGQFSIALTDFLIDGTNAGGGATGIDFTGARGIRIDNVQVTNMGDDGITADGFTSNSDAPTIRRVSLSSNGGDGMRLISVYAFRISESYFLINTGNGLNIQSGGEWSVTSSLFDQNTGRGIYTFATIGGVIDGNTYIGENLASGVDLGGTTSGVIVSDNFVIGNNRGNTSHSGVGVSDTATDNVITGNRILDDEVGFDKTQTYGVELGANTADNIVFNNNVLDNLTAGISPGGNSTQWIRDNKGYVTENWGMSTGTGGEQTLAHRLAAIPNYVFAMGNATDANVFQSSAADATNIYLTADNGEGYRWEAKVR